MLMKRFNIALIIVSIILVGVIVGCIISPKMPTATVHHPIERPPAIKTVVVERPRENPMDLPEYRPPPVQKYWRPQAPHQVGLLKGENGSDGLRPIYAKPSRTHRDRFHYWTTGGNGHNRYSVPVTLDGRDCTEDIGCKEMFGNESVSVWDNPEIQYKSHVYRHDMFF